MAAPGAAPIRKTFPLMASKAVSAASKAASGPDAMIVSVPASAPAFPPVTGASSMRWPLSGRT